MKSVEALAAPDFIVNHTDTMNPIISENHSETKVNVRRILKRMIKYQKPETLKDLNEIAILDNSIEDKGFGRYKRAERKIEIYLDPILKWQPWIIKKTLLSIRSHCCVKF